MRNAAVIVTTLKTGDFAYWDTFAGLIPVKVTAITGKSGTCSSEQQVHFEVTAAYGPYKKGEKCSTWGIWVIPRGCILRKKYSCVILPHSVECD